MNLVVVLALVAEGGHAHATSADASHPCAVCAVGATPAVAAAPQPAPAALAPAPEIVVERPVTRPAAPARALHSSRAPPASTR